jgi:HK97 family phage prohead protease
MTTLISADQFRKELRARRPPSGGVYRVSTEGLVPVDGAERTLRFCFSDNSVDRMGDTIDAAGWDLTDFNRNPVALWAHDSSAPPIGGARNVAVEGQRLMGDIEFARPETYAFAETIYRLLLDKFIRAVSVGFMPIKYRFAENDADRTFGIDFLEQSLLEISVCPVPANPNALADARRKGIDTRPLIEWAERTLEGGGKVMLPRAELDRLRKAAKEPAMARNPRSRSKGARADGATEDDPEAGTAAIGKCGRDPDAACGMTDPAECSVHGGSKAEPEADDTKTLAALLRRFLPRRNDDGGTGDDDLPLAHEDAIRLAHKSLRTSKAFLTEAVTHHAKALDLLGDVVDALDDAPESDPPADPAPDPDAEKALQLRRAAALKAKHKAARP